ncbi:MAG: hypothetical protein U0235_27235 [Polyangiaceae bacterium]
MTSALRDRILAHETQLRERAERGDDGIGLARAHAAFMDGLLRDAVADALRGHARAARFAVAGVGSYGRKTLAPRSDVDLRILFAKESDKDASSEWIERLLYPLWDAKLAVGHQAIVAEELLALAHKDLASATTLLDLRFVAGDEDLVRELIDRAYAGVFELGAVGDFIARLEDEITGRHERFGGSVYLLEPDTKSGAGGMRDLDTVRWVARARYRVSDDLPEGEARGLAFTRELVRTGVLVLARRRRSRRRRCPCGACGPFPLPRPAPLRSIDLRRAGVDRARARLLRRGRKPAARLGTMVLPAPRPPSASCRTTTCTRALYRARERRLFERARPPKRRAKPVEVDLGQGTRLFDGQVTLAGTKELADDPAPRFVCMLHVFASARPSCRSRATPSPAPPPIPRSEALRRAPRRRASSWSSCPPSARCRPRRIARGGAPRRGAPWP